jgi:hypothetical protein
MHRLATAAALLLLCSPGSNFAGAPHFFSGRWTDAASGAKQSSAAGASTNARHSLGFDRNEYPGGAALAALRETFTFSGYWLNVPPGASTNTWQGKRGQIRSAGFGFLVLFNGRLDRQLKKAAASIGLRDAHDAVNAATRNGFPAGTIIFIDQEEGGRMLPEQEAYLHAWLDAMNASAYRAGVYCSGIPFDEGGGSIVTTANDIRENAGGRRIDFLVYNDACTPSPGCVFPQNPPAPGRSGIPFATVWQFAQSPRRRKLTAKCPSSYDPDGSCYAPALKGRRIYVDLDTANSPDPSHGR